ncbi:hypothetical protein [Helicobacter sp. 'CLO3_human']|nr:hypothetical protein [Helicobacter sp. 'CLO3_human']
MSNVIDDLFSCVLGDFGVVVQKDKAWDARWIGLIWILRVLANDDFSF